MVESTGPVCAQSQMVYDDALSRRKNGFNSHWARSSTSRSVAEPDLISLDRLVRIQDGGPRIPGYPSGSRERTVNPLAKARRWFESSSWSYGPYSHGDEEPPQGSRSGSIPERSNHGRVSQLEESLLCTQEVAGPNPVASNYGLVARRSSISSAGRRLGFDYPPVHHRG